MDASHSSFLSADDFTALTFIQPSLSLCLQSLLFLSCPSFVTRHTRRSLSSKHLVPYRARL